MTLRNKIAYNFGGLLPFPTFHYGRSAPGYSLVSSLQNFRKGYRYYPCPIAFDTTSSRRTYGTPVTPVSLFQQSYSLFETSALRMHRRPFSFVDTTHTLESMCRRYTSFLISNTDNTLKSMRRRCISFVTKNTTTIKTVSRRCTDFKTNNPLRQIASQDNTTIITSRRTNGTPVASTLFFQQSYSLYETNALNMHRRPFSFGIYTPESMRHRCTNLPTNKTTITTCRRTNGTPVASTLLFQQSYSLYETNTLGMHHKPFSFASYTLEHMRRRCISFVTKNTNMNKSVLRRCTNFIIDTTANTLKRMRRRCISFVTENTNMNKSVRRRCTNFVTINILSYG